MKQIIITTCDKWSIYTGLETNGAILSREVIETDYPKECEDIEVLNQADFPDEDEVDYRIGVTIYNSEQEEERGIVYDSTTYWLKG